MDGIKLEFAKFSGENYSAWKFKMNLYLMQKGYWKAMTGEDKSAEKNEKALIMIGLAVNDDRIVYTQDAETAKEAWGNFASVYDNPGTANKM